MATLSEPEFWWLIGLLEGEGSFDLAGQNNCQRVRIDMTDEDTIYKAAYLLGKLGDCIAHVASRDNSHKANYKDSFYVQISGESGRQIMRRIVKHMSYRRRQQIWLALNKYPQKKLKERKAANVLSIDFSKVRINANG